jgi:hypothetical protein
MNDKSGHSRLILLHGKANDEKDASPHPNPTSLPVTVEPESVEGHRNVFCDRYDDCLDEALGKRWSSWSCEHCPMFAQDPALQATRLGHEALSRPEAQFL